MTFTPNIPQTGQSLGETRDNIRNNFTNYNNVISVNHYAPNDGKQGKHKFVEMPVQASSPTTLANEGGLFTKTSSGNSELYYQRDAVATDIQMTKGTPVLSGASGSTFLPGGFILKWINVVINSNPQTLNFTTLGIGSFPNNLFVATVTINVNDQNMQATVNDGLTNTIDVYTTQTGVTHFLILIGN